MKPSLLALLLVVVPVWTLSCSTSSSVEPSNETAAAPAAPQPAEDVESVITQLEREWVAAIVDNDRPTLDRLLADDFVGTSPSAHTYYKDAALRDLETGTYIVESMDLDEISVNVYGDTAISFTSQEEKSTYGGEDLSGHYHYTDVWIRRDGRWQVVASHGSRYDEPH